MKPRGLAFTGALRGRYSVYVARRLFTSRGGSEATRERANVAERGYPWQPVQAPAAAPVCPSRGRAPRAPDLSACVYLARVRVTLLQHVASMPQATVALIHDTMGRVIPYPLRYCSFDGHATG